MNKVVALKPVYSKRLQNADSCMSVIRMKMYQYDIDELADDIGVTTSCLYAVRRGSTIWPRPKTFFGPINAMDMKLLITA